MRDRRLNLPIGIVLLLVGAGLFGGAIYGFVHVPERRVLTCERLASGDLACEPGALRGPNATVTRASGKDPTDCFTLGRTTLCGGEVKAAVAKVEALPIGARAEIDLTPAKPPPTALLFSLVFGLVMSVVAIGTIRKSSRRP